MIINNVKNIEKYLQFLNNEDSVYVIGDKIFSINLLNLDGIDLYTFIYEFCKNKKLTVYHKNMIGIVSKQEILDNGSFSDLMKYSVDIGVLQKIYENNKDMRQDLEKLLTARGKNGKSILEIAMRTFSLSKLINNTNEDRRIYVTDFIKISSYNTDIPLVCNDSLDFFDFMYESLKNIIELDKNKQDDGFIVNKNRIILFLNTMKAEYYYLHDLQLTEKDLYKYFLKNTPENCEMINIYTNESIIKFPNEVLVLLLNTFLKSYTNYDYDDFIINKINSTISTIAFDYEDDLVKSFKYIYKKDYQYPLCLYIYNKNISSEILSKIDFEINEIAPSLVKVGKKVTKINDAIPFYLLKQHEQVLSKCAELQYPELKGRISSNLLSMLYYCFLKEKTVSYTITKCCLKNAIKRFVKTDVLANIIKRTEEYYKNNDCELTKYTDNFESIPIRFLCSEIKSDSVLTDIITLYCISCISYFIKITKNNDEYVEYQKLLEKFFNNLIILIYKSTDGYKKKLSLILKNILFKIKRNAIDFDFTKDSIIVLLKCISSSYLSNSDIENYIFDYDLKFRLQKNEMCYIINNDILNCRECIKSYIVERYLSE